MRAEAFIAGRMRFGGKLAVGATAVSFFVILLAVSISSGFRREIRNGLSDISGDIRVECGTDPIMMDEPWIASVASLPGVKEIAPAVYRPGILKKGDDIQGVVFKGVASPDTTSMGIRIPRRLSEVLDIRKGESLPAYFIGERVQARKFTVTGNYDAISDSKDRFVVLSGIDDLRRLAGWPEGAASALEIKLDENARDGKTMLDITEKVEELSSLAVSNIGDSYGNLFDWLNLIDTNVTAILLLMIAVAGFNMISGLLILLFRSTSAIGILKTMGMTNRGIAGVFLRIGARTVAVGMLAGNAAALLFCLVQNATRFIKLDPANYFLSFVPVNMDFAQVLAVDVIAFVAIEILLLIPCLFISGVDPSKTVRAE